MEAVILIGLPSSGKTTFCLQHFHETHLRLNHDMLRTRRREKVILYSCVACGQPFVVDGTNPAVADRAHYIAAAKPAGYQVVGYYFPDDIKSFLARREGGPESGKTPEPAVLETARRMERPAKSEGFDALWQVRPNGNGGFRIEAFPEP